MYLYSIEILLKFILGKYYSHLINQSFQGEMSVTPSFYAHLTSLLMPLASGKLAVILEVSTYIHVLILMYYMEYVISSC